MVLLIHELLHLLFGASIGLVFWVTYRNTKLLIASILTSLLLDLDHFIDLFLFTSQQNKLFTPWTIITENYFAGSGKVYVVFHSYEIVILLLIIGYYMRRLRPYLLVVSASICAHILFDSFTYKPALFEYFLTYRIMNDFSIEAFR